MTTTTETERTAALLDSIRRITDPLAAHLRHHATLDLQRIWPALKKITFDVESYSNDDGTYGTQIDAITAYIEVSGSPISLYIGSLSDIDGNIHEFEQLRLGDLIELGVGSGVLDAALHKQGAYDQLELADPDLAPLWQHFQVQDIEAAFRLVVLLIVHREDDSYAIDLKHVPFAPKFDAAPIEHLMDFVATVPNVEPVEEGA